ncbi:NAD(P)/FAD-dependent oxidoreductase [Oceanobacillus sp. FSL K6-2867]|uniref:flavin monoamine oxidase family protein n=1 Tax=Oceanobacillus sp. FSL K6-2867 TaxID=2954748 RepID=UPI0030DBCEE5
MTSTNYDVIIVGAGFSGVTASRELSNRGFKTLVLEGRNRIGGRTWTDNRLGKNIEIGGTYVHWNQPHMWAELTRYNLQVRESPTMEKAYWIKDGKVKSGTYEELQEKHMIGMEEFLKGGRDYFPRPYNPFFDNTLEEVDHLSVADRLKAVKPLVSKDVYSILESTWSEYTSTDDLDQPGLAQAYRWAALTGHDMNQFQDTFELFSIETGTKSLIESIANDSKADLQLSTPVSVIEKTDKGYKVTTRNGSDFTAKSVIVAVPVNVINNIEFKPALPAELRQFSSEKQSSRGIKVWAKVRGLTSSVKLKAGPEYPVNSAHAEYIDGDEAILMGFGNDSTLNMEDPKEVEKAFRHWLPDIEVIESAGHNWVKDEFSQGTWGVLKKNQLSKYVKEVPNTENGLFLAGSDFAKGWVGYMDGAIETGITTSKRVEKYLQEQELALAKN